jgi:hypothetical protein
MDSAPARKVWKRCNWMNSNVCTGKRTGTKTLTKTVTSKQVSGMAGPGTWEFVELSRVCSLRGFVYADAVQCGDIFSMVDIDPPRSDISYLTVRRGAERTRLLVPVQCNVRRSRSTNSPWVESYFYHPGRAGRRYGRPTPSANAD